MDPVARLFLAVPLDEEARHALAARIRDAAPRGLPGRPVPPPNWHLTLRFLGDVGAVAGDRLAGAMGEADLGAPFDVVWGALGAFPRPRRANVLWVGMDRGAGPMGDLAARVEDAAVAGGFPPGDRPFRAHLTVSRIRPDQDVTALLDAAGPLGVPMRVARVVLYRSHLGRGGARYEEVEEFHLG